MTEPRFVRNKERLQHKRILIIILSCLKHAMDGSNQAIRDTWVKDVNSCSALDYRFFIGNGSPTGQDETLLLASWNLEESERYRNKVRIDPDISLYKPNVDEVFLNAPDKYEYMSYKLKEACRWGLGRGYEVFFQCLTDTYIAVDRLVDRKPSTQEYLGTSNCEGTYLGGGPGYWLSRKAAQFLVEAPVTHWAYDIWAGRVLLDKEVKLHHDPCYTNLDAGDVPPLPDNLAITSHIANCPTVYDIKQMYELHKRYKG